MNSREYWIKRAQHREAVSWSNGLEASAALIRVYKQTSTEIRRDINDFYMRYAGENGLSYEQAVREMSRPEMQEWKNSVEGYIREIQNCTDEKVRERLMREYDARSYNSRISRLEGLCGNINMNLDTLYQLANQRFREVLGDTFRDGYYKTLYDIQCRRGFNPFSTIDSEIVENALTYPWSGANFSDRLWKNKNALMDSLRETLTKGMIRGDNIREMSKNIAEKLNASYSNAERLILTESSHIHNTAELSAYEAAGYEQYEFMASPGEKTCEVCGELDGKRFKLSEKQYGVNFPPIHPRCRCTTIGFDPEDEEDEKNAIEEGHGDGFLPYEEWYSKFVENGVDKSAKSGIIKASKATIKLDLQYFAVVPKEKFTKYALDPVKQPDKARAFREALGYTMDNYQDLIDNISANLDESALKFKGSNEHGKLYEYVMRLIGANGKQANVCTGWIIENGKTEPRLTSAYVTQKKVTKKDDD